MNGVDVTSGSTSQFAVKDEVFANQVSVLLSRGSLGQALKGAVEATVGISDSGVSSTAHGGGSSGHASENSGTAGLRRGKTNSLSCV